MKDVRAYWKGCFPNLIILHLKSIIGGSRFLKYRKLSRWSGGILDKWKPMARLKKNMMPFKDIILSKGKSNYIKKNNKDHKAEHISINVLRNYNFSDSKPVTKCSH